MDSSEERNPTADTVAAEPEADLNTLATDSPSSDSTAPTPPAPPAPPAPAPPEPTPGTEDAKPKEKPETEQDEAKKEGNEEPKPKPAKKEPEGPKFLDLAFAMDCTGSMRSYISQAQRNIRRIVEEIVSKEKADVRLALVQYRDHPPQDSTFVTKTNDFTESVRKMKGWLDGCSAQGGGDGPEAVADALHQVLKLNWREEATKICVFISDAPPHGLDPSGDGFPNGCPDGLDPMTITNQLAEKGVMIYMVGCEPSISPYRDFFMALAEITGGQYVPLASATVLAKVIIGGAQEEISLQQLREEVNREVMAEIEAVADDDCVAQSDITSRVYSKMKKKGVVTKQLKMNQCELPQASAAAMKYSDFDRLEDVRKDFKKSSAPMPRSSYYHSAAPMEAAESSGGGLFGSVMGYFGRKSTPSSAGGPPPPPPAMAAAPMSAPMMASSCADDYYDVVEGEYCEAQAARMVQQSIKQNRISKSKCKKM